MRSQQIGSLPILESVSGGTMRQAVHVLTTQELEAEVRAILSQNGMKKVFVLIAFVPESSKHIAPILKQAEHWNRFSDDAMLIAFAGYHGVLSKPDQSYVAAENLPQPLFD